MLLITQHPLSNHLNLLATLPMKALQIFPAYSKRRWDQLRACENLRRRLRTSTYSFPIERVACIPSNFPACFYPAGKALPAS